MNEQEETRYFIDLTCISNENRSVAIIIGSRLCPKCQKKKNINLEKEKPEVLVSMFKNCCSKLPDFITPKMPVSEKLFRIFLASGNQPLTVKELLAKLQSYSGVSSLLSESALMRLLDSNRYYCFSRYSKI